MTLKQKKQKNYMALRALLGELEQNIVCRLDLSNAQEVMKRKINEDDELRDIAERFAKAHPDLVQETDTGYRLSMIFPETKNEEDPVMDVLFINRVEDIFQVRDVLSNAFLGLFSKED